jgi:hypothetical protein
MRLGTILFPTCKGVFNTSVEAEKGNFTLASAHMA